MTSGLLDLLPKIVISVKVEDVGHQIKCILIVRDLGVEAGQIEAIGQVILVNLAEVFVAPRGDKLSRREMVSFQHPKAAAELVIGSPGSHKRKSALSLSSANDEYIHRQATTSEREPHDDAGYPGRGHEAIHSHGLTQSLQ